METALKLAPSAPHVEIVLPRPTGVEAQEQRRLFQALAAGLLGIWERDLRTGRTTCSAGVANVFGCVPKSLEAYLACIHPEDRAWVGDAARPGLAVADYLIQYRVVRPDGAVRWVEDIGRVVRDDTGAVTGMIGTCQDVTARVEAEEALRQHGRELQAITDNVPILIARVDSRCRYVFANRAYRDRLGIPVDQVIGSTLWDVLGAGAYETIRPHVERALAGEPVDYEATLDYRTIGPRRIHGSYVPERGPDGQVCGFLLSATDVTERHQAAQARRRAETVDRRLALIVENSHEAIFSTGLDGTVLSWNRAAERLFGYPAGEMIGRSVGRLYPEAERGELAARLERLRQPDCDGIEMYDAVRVCRDGTQRSVSVTISPVRDADGNVTEHARIVRDITEQKAAERERERLLEDALARADRDPLTGLLNHRAFHKRLEEEADRAAREGTRLAVVMMDLDNFKFFNDAYGHRAGDEVLRLVAEVLRGSCRSYDTLARFGGDEFALLLPGLAESDAGDLARAIAARLDDRGYLPPDHDAPIPLGLSLGVAVFPDDTPHRGGVLDLADARLRLAKTGADENLLSAERLRTDLVQSVAGFSMLDALVTSVDTKDRYTRRHSEDVLVHSLQIADELGLDAPARQDVAIAALLHDVGKIGVPDAVLRKPGGLTADEFAAVRQHPQMGAGIVGAVPGFEAVLDAIRHHHERWDGGGYPAGLRGEETPPVARLLAVADAFSAMTTDRPYRKGLAEAKALSILRDGAGAQWDPACVTAFLRARAARAG